LLYTVLLETTNWRFPKWKLLYTVLLETTNWRFPKWKLLYTVLLETTNWRWLLDYWKCGESPGLNGEY